MSGNYAFYFFVLMVVVTLIMPPTSPLFIGLQAFWVVFGGFLAVSLASLIVSPTEEGKK